MNYEIVLATSNPHKVQEVRSILAPHGIVLYGLNDLNIKLDDVEENGSTYQENAIIKAKAVAKIISKPVIADDSGLEILALDKKPGLFSARYAKEMGGHQNAMKKIISDLDGKDHSAQFVCDIALLNVEDKPLIFEGIATGHIIEEAKGKEGFGYDPIFFSDDLNMTFAEADEKEKNKVSHRGKALKKLLTYLLINGFISK